MSLPNLQILSQIRQHILNIPNKCREHKRKAHYGLFLLCAESGLRVSEAVKFDLSEKTKKGLYRIDKPKRKKERYVYIPKSVINELKKHNWKPNSTNRFNFYHFLKNIKRELGISKNVELTPHTLRRAFTTYHAEAGFPLPLLSKLLGHASVRTTALYWMNIYNDEGNDNDDILTGKFWLEKPKPPQPEPQTPVKVKLELPELLTPNPLASKPQPDYLSKIKHLENQLSQIQQENKDLKAELGQTKKQNKSLESDLTELSEQKAHQIKQREQIQHDLTEAKQIIKQLEQQLTTAESNLTQEKQISHNLRQQLQTEQEINANLTQKIPAYEQNYANLQKAYQITLKDKQAVEKQLNQLTREIKKVAQQLYQWQKLNHYQSQKAQIIQIERPPPWRTK